MLSNTIIFSINNLEFLQINIPCRAENLFRYDEVTIYYINRKKNQQYIIYTRDFIIHALRVLESFLNMALTNQLKLHQSINKDLGYLWSEYYGSARDGRLKKPTLTYELTRDGEPYWVIYDYMFLSTPGNHIPNVTSWLYEKDGEFFFEITPNYPPDYRWDQMKLKDAKKDPNFKTFKEFMATYQPLVVTTIERSVLEQWYKQVQQLIPLIEANDSKYFIKEAHKES